MVTETTQTPSVNWFNVLAAASRLLQLKQPIKQRQWIQSIADCQFPIADCSP
jgi:hypothetical protein